MFLGWFWACAVICGAVFVLVNGRAGAVSAAAVEGAARAVELCISMAGPLALWAGLGRLMERVGLMDILAKVLSPVLARLFPQFRDDPELAGQLSANVTANLLGLGNAATPAGIRAAGRLRDPRDPARATDALCRLVVMNTASIQLLPTTVAAVRQSAGCATPFDILPCVWVSSILSVTAGLIAAKIMGRFWRG